MDAVEKVDQNESKGDAAVPGAGGGSGGENAVGTPAAAAAAAVADEGLAFGVVNGDPAPPSATPSGNCVLPYMSVGSLGLPSKGWRYCGVCGDRGL